MYAVCFTKCTLVNKAGARIRKCSVYIIESQREKTYLPTCDPIAQSDQSLPFVVHRKKHRILGYPNCAQWRFWSDCANAQADLNLRWAHMSEVRFLILRLRYFLKMRDRHFAFSVSDELGKYQTSILGYGRGGGVLPYVIGHFTLYLLTTCVVRLEQVNFNIRWCG